MGNCAKCGCENANHKIPKGLDEYYYLCDECFDSYKRFVERMQPALEQIKKVMMQAAENGDVEMNVSIIPVKEMDNELEDERYENMTLLEEYKDRYNEGIRMLDKYRKKEIDNELLRMLAMLEVQLEYMKDRIDELENGEPNLSIYKLYPLERLMEQYTKEENYEMCNKIKQRMEELK